MGYIRSNEDYYRSLGHSLEDSKAMGDAVDNGTSAEIDEGYCNPIKLKLAAEAIEQAREDGKTLT